MTYTVGEIAKGMGAAILCGDPERTVSAWTFSSKEGSADTMFLPMKGERVDAHDFIADAYAHGVRVTTTERGEIVPGTEDMTYLAVDNARDAWQRLGAYWRRKHAGVPMIAVTGSVGKTTTKELTALALSPFGNVLKTSGNHNGQLGVPLMMAELSDDTDCAVIEMGMSLPGEMGRIAAVAMPDCAAITNIGLSHIGNLGSQEGIRREKLSIVNRLRDGGTLFVNGDDPLLRVLCPDCPDYAGTDGILMYPETRERFRTLTVVAYGAESWCRYRYSGEVLTEGTASFTYEGPNGSLPVMLPVPGHHNVSNATLAIAAAETMISGSDIASEAAKALAAYKPMSMRGGRETLPGGILMIDDTYNASPDSMRSGLDVLCAVNAGRHIAMLADMFELGDHAEAGHRRVGRDVAERAVDVLITVGELSEAIADEAEKRTAELGRKMSIFRVKTREEGRDLLLPMLREGDAVLLKGSRGMKLDEVADALRKREARDDRQDNGDGFKEAGDRTV